MQRIEADYVVISCDFCAADWDEVRPMIEGHRGSVLCLECLKRGLAGARPAAASYACTLCLREGLPATLPRWQSPARPVAVVCQDCLFQAARAFDRDPDVDWEWDQ